jgi:hypothetical protein
MDNPEKRLNRRTVKLLLLSVLILAFVGLMVLIVNKVTDNNDKNVVEPNTVVVPEISKEAGEKAIKQMQDYDAIKLASINSKHLEVVELSLEFYKNQEVGITERLGSILLCIQSAKLLGDSEIMNKCKLAAGELLGAPSTLSEEDKLDWEIRYSNAETGTKPTTKGDDNVPR